MRIRVLPSAALLLSLLILSPPGAAEQARSAVRVRASARPARPVAGQTVTLTITVAASDGISSLPFHLAYDPGILRFEGGDEGPFLRGQGASTVFLAGPVSGTPEIAVGVSLLGDGSSARGKGAVCTLRFTALAPGLPNLRFTHAGALDEAGRRLEADFKDPRLRVR